MLLIGLINSHSLIFFRAKNEKANQSIRGQVIRQVLNESIQPQVIRINNWDFSWLVLNIHVRRNHVYLFIIWLSWSALKRSFLIGSLSGPNFSMRTTKIDRSRKDLTKSCFGKILEVVWSRNLILPFLAYNFGKNHENDITKIVCSLLSSFWRVLTNRNTLCCSHICKGP